MVSCRVVIIRQEKAENGRSVLLTLLMHRIKSGNEFYLFPGGHIEQGETEEQTAIREFKEETNLDIVLERKLGTVMSMWEGSLQPTHFFLAKSWQGLPKIIGEEVERNTPDNRYELVWMRIDGLHKVKMYPKGVEEIIQQVLQQYHCL